MVQPRSIHVAKRADALRAEEGKTPFSRAQATARDESRADTYIVRVHLGTKREPPPVKVTVHFLMARVDQ